MPFCREVQIPRHLAWGYVLICAFQSLACFVFLLIHMGLSATCFVSLLFAQAVKHILEREQEFSYSNFSVS